jgi:hypothetical protein
MISTNLVMENSKINSMNSYANVAGNFQIHLSAEVSSLLRFLSVQTDFRTKVLFPWIAVISVEREPVHSPRHAKAKLQGQWID